ncbi:hypothetical protein Tco_0155782 [Tanacetum coccineum]
MHLTTMRLEMVAKHDQKVAVEKEGKKKQQVTEATQGTKALQQRIQANQHLLKREFQRKATPLQKVGEGKVVKVHNVKSSFQLVDEPDEEPAQPEPETEPEIEYRGESEEYDVERAIQMSLESFQAHGHIAHSWRMFGDEQGDDVTKEVNLEDKTAEINEGQAGSDPGNTPESRPLPDDNKMDED